MLFLTDLSKLTDAELSDLTEKALAEMKATRQAYDDATFYYGRVTGERYKRWRTLIDAQTERHAQSEAPARPIPLKSSS